MIFRRSQLIAAASFAFATLALGQQVVVPNAPSDIIPSTPPHLRAGPALPPGDNRSPTPESPLMPDLTPSLVKPDAATPAATAAKTPKVSKTETFEQDLATKIKYRQANTLALADPAVQAEWTKSLRMRTDAGKREVLRGYYKLLFARMAKIDPSIKVQIDLQALNAEHRLTQVRLAPSSIIDEGERSLGQVVIQ